MVGNPAAVKVKDNMTPAETPNRDVQEYIGIYRDIGIYRQFLSKIEVLI